MIKKNPEQIKSEALKLFTKFGQGNFRRFDLFIINFYNLNPCLHIDIALQIHSGRVSQQYIYWLEEYD